MISPSSWTPPWRAGVDIVQLRDKGSAGERQFGRLEPTEELEYLAILSEAAARHGALFAVNDRADIAWPRAPTSYTWAKMTCRWPWPGDRRTGRADRTVHARCRAGHRGRPR